MDTLNAEGDLTMSVPKKAIFNILLILSAVCFAAAIAVHLITLISAKLIAPYWYGIQIAIVMSLAVLLILANAVLFFEAQFRSIIKRNLFFYQFDSEYYRVGLQLSFDFTPVWAVVVLVGLVIYSVFSVQLGANLKLPEIVSFGMLFFSAMSACVYWGCIWFWHTQVVRLELSVEGEGAL